MRCRSASSVAIGLTLAASASAHAATIQVTTTTDTDELGFGSRCSLREAIYSANTDSNAMAPGCAAGKGTGEFPR